MKNYEIGVVVGSLRKASFNYQLSLALAQLAPREVAFNNIFIGDLPLYNQDHDNEPSEAVKKFKAEILASQGILFITPEYNRSIPGVLKNALDHGSRPYGHNAWAAKPAAIVGVSVGFTGTALAQQHLRNILAYLDMPTLNQPEVFLQMKEGLFDATGAIGPQSLKFLQAWMHSFIAWVKKHNSN